MNTPGITTISQRYSVTFPINQGVVVSDHPELQCKTDRNPPCPALNLCTQQVPRRITGGRWVQGRWVCTICTWAHTTRTSSVIPAALSYRRRRRRRRRAPCPGPLGLRLFPVPVPMASSATKGIHGTWHLEGTEVVGLLSIKYLRKTRQNTPSCDSLK